MKSVPEQAFMDPIPGLWAILAILMGRWGPRPPGPQSLRRSGEDPVLFLHPRPLLTDGFVHTLAAC